MFSVAQLNTRYGAQACVLGAEVQKKLGLQKYFLVSILQRSCLWQRFCGFFLWAATKNSTLALPRTRLPWIRFKTNY